MPHHWTTGDGAFKKENKCANQKEVLEKRATCCQVLSVDIRIVMTGDTFQNEKLI